MRLISFKPVVTIALSVLVHAALQAQTSMPLPFPDGQTGQGRIVADADGALHTSFANQASGDIYYATCAADCNNGENWLGVQIASAPEGQPYSSLDSGVYTQTEVTPDGQPRIGFVHVYLTSNNPIYSYAECSGECTDPAGWQGINLLVTDYDDFGSLKYSRWFALSPDGNPRMVIPQQSQTDAGRYLKETVYLHCNESCLDVDNWAGSLIDRVQDALSVSTPVYSMALTTDGRPFIAMRDGDIEVSSEANRPPEWSNHLVLYQCMSDCESSNPVVEADIIYTESPWPLNDFVLELDAADYPRIAASALWTEFDGTIGELAVGYCDADNCADGSAWSWRLVADTPAEVAFGLGVYDLRRAEPAASQLLCRQPGCAGEERLSADPAWLL